MDQPKYFEIISPESFLDKFVERAFIHTGFKSLPQSDGTTERTAVYVAPIPCPDFSTAIPSAAAQLIIIAPVETKLPDMSKVKIPTAILRIPFVIGTGMTGLMRDIVAMTGRGTMFHIEGNEARVSVVHAIDVARVAAKLVGMNGEYTITDGNDPTWHDLIEAISVRVGHKRISSFSPRRVKWLTLAGALWGGPDREMVKRLTTDTIVAPTPLPFDYTPLNVVDYLTNHEYTDEDL